MRVTRDVVQDLLPLYVSGEASQDTAALVEEYLRTDPELAAAAKKLSAPDLSKAPAPISKEAEMEAYKKANTLMVVRTLGLAAILAGVFLSTVLIVPLIYKFLAG